MRSRELLIGIAAAWSLGLNAQMGPQGGTPGGPRASTPAETSKTADPGSARAPSSIPKKEREEISAARRIETKSDAKPHGKKPDAKHENKESDAKAQKDGKKSKSAQDEAKTGVQKAKGTGKKSIESKNEEPVKSELKKQ
jgi:hypothetical protein